MRKEASLISSWRPIAVICILAKELVQPSPQQIQPSTMQCMTGIDFVGNIRRNTVQQAGKPKWYALEELVINQK